MILQNDTYVQKAEEAIIKLKSTKDKWGNSMIPTTSQIRNLLSMTNEIYNEVRLLRDDKLNEDIRGKINYLKIRIVYEAGRDDKVKEFVNKAEILRCIDEVRDNRENYLLFSRYMEALVAYHRFNGGKDK